MATAKTCHFARTTLVKSLILLPCLAMVGYVRVMPFPVNLSFVDVHM